MVAVPSTSHLPIIIDPDGIFGEPEVAYVTAHTLNATTCTLTRGQEGSVARAHNRDTPWLHGSVISDFALAGTMLPAWTAATLQNSWTNYGSDGGGAYSTCGYYLGPDGTVHLRGLIVAGTLTASTKLFTLPAGFRPEQNSIHPIWTTSGYGMRVNVYQSGAPTVGSSPTDSGPGTVNIQTGGGSAPSAGAIISLDGISFRQFG